MTIVLGPDDHFRSAQESRALRAVRRRFPDGEQLVGLAEAGELAGRDVLIVHTTTPPQDERLTSLLQLVSLVRDAGPASVSCFVPYLCYQRQDRRTGPGEAVSGPLVMRLLAAAGADRLLTVDAHNPAVGDAAPLAFDNLRAAPAFAGHVRRAGLDADVVVSPDRGGASRAALLADLLGLPVVVLEKRKDEATAKTRYDGVPGSLSGRHCLVLDDLCSSGSTLVPLCEALAARRARSTIFLTHLLTTPAKLLSLLPGDCGLVTTDSCGDRTATVSVLPLALDAWRSRPIEPAGGLR